MIHIWIRCMLGFKGLFVDSVRDFGEKVWLRNIWMDQELLKFEEGLLHQNVGPLYLPLKM